MLIGWRIVKFQFIAAFLPGLYRKRKEIMKFDWQAIKSLLKSYVRAIAWLTLVTWAPSHISCKISKLVGKMNWLTSLLSLVIST